MCQEHADHARGAPARPGPPRARARRGPPCRRGRRAPSAPPTRKNLQGGPPTAPGRGTMATSTSRASSAARCQLGEGRRRVGAHHQGERAVRVLGEQRLDGVDRVGRPGAAQLEVADRRRGRRRRRRRGPSRRAARRARRAGASLRCGSARDGDDELVEARARRSRRERRPRGRGAAGRRCPPNSPRARPATRRAYGARGASGGRTLAAYHRRDGRARASTVVARVVARAAGRPAADLARRRGAEARRGAALRALPPLVFAGEARRLTDQLAEVRAGPGVPPAGRRLRRVLRRRLGRLHPRQAQGHPADGGRPHLRDRRPGGQGRPHRRAVRQAPLAPTEEVDGVDARDASAATWSTTRPSTPTRADPTPGGSSPPTTSRPRRSTCCAPSPRAASPTSSQVHAWNQEFVATSAEGRRYERIADEIERALRFMRACGIDLDARAPAARGRLLHEPRGADPRLRGGPHAPRLAHRRLVRLLGAPALDRRAHPPARRRPRRVRRGHPQPASACKLGPTATPAEVVALAERLNPDRMPGRLTFITRLGADRVRGRCSRRSSRRSAPRATPSCGPATRCTATRSPSTSGRKTRRFDDILAEIRGFFAVHRALGTWPGGVHVELTGDDVTECLGGAEAIVEGDLDANYTSICDPRLNARQSPRPRLPGLRAPAR